MPSPFRFWPHTRAGGLWCLSYSLTLASLFLFSWEWPAALLAAHLAFLGWGVASLRLRFFCPAFWALARGSGRICLTFDDGPDARLTPLVLDLLREFDFRATFFLVARRAESHPELVARMVKEGHEVACHDLHHSWRSNLRSERRMATEVGIAVEILTKAAGRRPTLYRPPFGLSSPSLAPALAEQGLVCVGWSHRARDAGNRRRSRYRSFKRMAREGAVVLLHDALPKPAHREEFLVGLRELCMAIAAQGLEPVGVSEALSGGWFDSGCSRI